MRELQHMHCKGTGSCPLRLHPRYRACGLTRQLRRSRLFLSATGDAVHAIADYDQANSVIALFRVASISTVAYPTLCTATLDRAIADLDRAIEMDRRLR
jgi:hypothetical protein